MKFTVLVITYNSDLYKLLLTLKSIISQHFDEFEIVISDDASAKNHFENIEKFFKENDYKEYRLIANKNNQGTVKNILSGLQHATGKYVKCISAGDLLFDENVLQNVYDYMEKNMVEGCFGLLRGYRFDKDGQCTLIPYYHPFDMRAYRLPNMQERILKNLILYSDNVCGAAICTTKKFYKTYLEKIRDYVTYEEDIFQVLAAVEQQQLCLYDDYMIWYEIGEGISTKKHSKFEELLRQDVQRFYDFLYQKHGDNKYVKKRHQLLWAYKIKNLYMRTVLRFFVNPDAIRYLISSFIQRYKNVHVGKREGMGFLQSDLFIPYEEREELSK